MPQGVTESLSKATPTPSHSAGLKFLSFLRHYTSLPGLTGKHDGLDLQIPLSSMAQFDQLPSIAGNTSRSPLG